MKTTETTSVSHDWGGYFAHAVQEEVNPIFSFQEFLAHLHAWNAPEELKRQCEQIIEAEQTSILLLPSSAGYSETTAPPDLAHATIFELALHNAIEGCIEETWSEVLIALQAKNSPNTRQHY